MSQVYQADESKMQFMVNIANRNTFLGIYVFFFRPPIFTSENKQLEPFFITYLIFLSRV